MSDLDPLQHAEQILKSLERELVERLAATDPSAETPQINSAVGRLTFIDAYHQHQVALHARRKLESQLTAIRAALKRVKEGT